MSVHLENVILEIKMEQQDTKTQHETGDNSTTWNVRSNQDSINASAVIKEEYDREEDGVPLHKNDDCVNIERIYIKEEKLENLVEDEYTGCYTEDVTDYANVDCKSEICIEEHSLDEVKKEPTSDSETAQDGSTSQADVTDVEINKTEKKSSDATKYMVSEESALEKDVKLNECEICKKKFKQVGDLARHMRIHSGERPYACDVCPKKFIQSGDLNRHMRTHGGIRPNICEICNEHFVQKRNLKSHMRRKHSDKRTYECEICKKKFTKRSNLNSHMLSHSDERPHECEICKKTFIHKWHLDVHMRKHSGERPYECKMCVKKFIQSGDLRRHMRIHTGERPYECEVCKKTFCVKSNFSKHIRTHSNAKTF